jgi:hypothetical protein
LASVVCWLLSGKQVLQNYGFLQEHGSPICTLHQRR